VIATDQAVQRQIGLQRDLLFDLVGRREQLRCAQEKTRPEEGIHDDHFTICHRVWRRAGRHQGRSKVLTATLVGTAIELMTLQPQMEYQP
jgi:hypothetical protein